MAQPESIRPVVFFAAPGEFGKLRIPIVQEGRIPAGTEHPDDFSDSKGRIESGLPCHHPALTRILNCEGCMEQFLGAPAPSILVPRVTSIAKFCRCHLPHLVGA